MSSPRWALATQGFELGERQTVGDLLYLQITNLLLALTKYLASGRVR